MHRAAPGVNWREIERANRHAAALCRQAAAVAAPDTAVPGDNPEAEESTATATPVSGAWRQRGASGTTGRTWDTTLAADGQTLLIGSGDYNGAGCSPGCREARAGRSAAA